MALTKKEKTIIIKKLFEVIRLIDVEWKDKEPKKGGKK